MAKKNTHMRVEIRAKEEMVEKAKNILFTMRDQIKEEWVCESDNLEIGVDEKEIDSDEDISEAEEEIQGKKQSKTLSLSFFRKGEELSRRGGKGYSEA